MGFGLNEKGARVGWLEARNSGVSAATQPASTQRVVPGDAIDLDTVKIVDGAFQISVYGSYAIFKEKYADIPRWISRSMYPLPSFCALAC